jgi:nucleoside-triphosphatase THEP1
MKSQIIAQKLSSHYVFESDCLSFSLYKFLLSEDKIGTRGYQFIDFISGLTENDVVIIDEIGKKFLEMNLPSKNSMLNTIFLEPWQLNKSELLLLIKPDKSKRYFNFMSRYSDRCIVKEILDKQSVKSSNSLLGF